MDRQKGLAPILIVILIALAVGGYLVYSKQTTQSTPAPKAASPVPNGTGETANPDSIGANWQTYVNTKYKYSLRYPDNWRLITYTQTDDIYKTIGLNPDDSETRQGNELSVDIESGTVAERISFHKELGNLNSQPEDLTIADIAAKRFSTTLSNGDKVTEILLSQGSNLFVVSYKGNYQTIIQKILSTFKFQ